MTALGRLAFLGIALSVVSLRSLAEMRITFIDAGQADASVIQIMQTAGEPFTILVDGGDGDSDLKDNLPTILAQDPTIELVVISHPHKDHVGALDWLVNSSDFTLERVWWTEEFHTDANYRRFRTGILEKGIIASRPEESFHHFIGSPNFTLRVFNNGQEFADTHGTDINNDSLVFQIIYEPSTDAEVSVLFTGDIEEAQGRMLVEQYDDQLQSDIVKVPHHGSDHLFEKFPEKVAARFAFVSSSGTNRRFKHPRKVALERYAQTAEVFCTCDAAEEEVHLTVQVTDAGEISVSPQQPPYFVWERQEDGELHKVIVP